MKFLNLYVALFILLIFAGCINLSYNQKFDRDGSSLIIQKMDLSQVVALSQSYQNYQKPGQTSIDEQMKETCQNLTKHDSGATCDYANGVLAISKKIDIKDADYAFTKENKFPNIVYNVKISSLPKTVESSSLSQQAGSTGQSLDIKFSDPKSKTSASSFKLLKATLNYSIQMPGTIVTAANGGKIENNIANYDVIDLMDKGQNIDVTSQELDPIVFLLGGGAAVLIVIVVIGLFVLMRKK